MHVLAEQTDWVSASAAWAAALAAVVYTGFTIWLVIETIKLRKAQTDPAIVLRVQRAVLDARLVELCISNVGGSAARDIGLECVDDLELAGLGASRLLHNPPKPLLDYLAPGDSRVLRLGRLDWFAKKGIGSVQFELRFRETSSRKIIVDKCRLDLLSLVQATPGDRIGLEMGMGTALRRATERMESSVHGSELRDAGTENCGN